MQIKNDITILAKFYPFFNQMEKPLDAWCLFIWNKSVEQMFLRCSNISASACLNLWCQITADIEIFSTEANSCQEKINKKRNEKNKNTNCNKSSFLIWCWLLLNYWNFDSGYHHLYLVFYHFNYKVIFIFRS